MNRLQVDLAYGQILDLGLEHYGEFAVSPEYADELMNGGMTSVDGRSGRLMIIERFENAVQLRWEFDRHLPAAVQPQLRAVNE